VCPYCPKIYPLTHLRSHLVGHHWFEFRRDAPVRCNLDNCVDEPYFRLGGLFIHMRHHPTRTHIRLHCRLGVYEARAAQILTTWAAHVRTQHGEDEVSGEWVDIIPNLVSSYLNRTEAANCSYRCTRHVSIALSGGGSRRTRNAGWEGSDDRVWRCDRCKPNPGRQFATRELFEHLGEAHGEGWCCRHHPDCANLGRIFVSQVGFMQHVARRMGWKAPKKPYPVVFTKPLFFLGSRGQPGQGDSGCR